MLKNGEAVFTVHNAGSQPFDPNDGASPPVWILFYDAAGTVTGGLYGVETYGPPGNGIDNSDIAPIQPGQTQTWYPVGGAASIPSGTTSCKASFNELSP
jgi:hypothetical protein